SSSLVVSSSALASCVAVSVSFLSVVVFSSLLLQPLTIITVNNNVMRNKNVFLCMFFTLHFLKLVLFYYIFISVYRVQSSIKPRSFGVAAKGLLTVCKAAKKRCQQFCCISLPSKTFDNYKL